MRKIIFFAAWMMAVSAVISVDNASAGVDTGINDSGINISNNNDSGINNSGINNSGINNTGININNNNDSDIGINNSGININNNDAATTPIPVKVTRKGRTVQVDGFLLEWDAGTSRRWAGSSWAWDAVITAHGVAGYFTLPGGSGGINSPGAGIDQSGPAIDTAVIDTAAPGCQSWAFTVTAVNTKKSFAMTIPEESSGKHFAFDRGTFESAGTLTVEWLVPWGFFEDEDGDDGDVDTYMLALTGACGAGKLVPMDVSVPSPTAPRAPAGRGTQAAMIAVTAALTVALVLHRRRKIREFGKRQEKS